jgi:hypothetical protein
MHSRCIPVSGHDTLTFPLWHFGKTKHQSCLKAYLFSSYPSNGSELCPELKAKEAEWVAYATEQTSLSLATR